METQNVPKIKVLRKSANSGLDPLFNIYSHYRHPPKPYFFTPRSDQSASFFRVVPRMPPRGCKMAPPGPKNGESGVPRAPQGCQRGSQCLPKCSQKSSKISTPLQDCLQGCSRVPRVPPRPQNTSIFDVPPTGVTPRKGNVHLSPPSLCYTPLTSSRYCEASLERGGLGVCPLE